ncbi:hypothetical protein P692DRAFT_20831722, partial [Suillus brevipes Sb2]
TVRSRSSLRRPHLVRSDGASILNLYYHLKPHWQPCYTKSHSDSQHSASSLSIILAASVLIPTSILTYPAPASPHSTCR